MFTIARIVLQFIDIVSESAYAHAANAWQRFSIRMFGEYGNLYLKTVLLLVGIFENFCDSCIASYELDPAYYYTLPILHGM